MIVQQDLEDGRAYTFSDANKYILQVETGIEYIDAVDVKPVKYTYKETDKDIPVIEDPENENDSASDDAQMEE